MKTSTQNKQSSSYMLYAVIMLLTVALLLLTASATQLQNNASLATRQIIQSQQQQGKSCGLFTQKEAALFLENNTITTSGTIIDASAPTAASRPGSPRVDSCSYVGGATNGVYADIVVKTYASEEDAKKYYQESVNKVLFIQQQESKEVDQLWYAAGVHYGLLQNTILEVSAAKIGAAVGEEQRMLSLRLFELVVNKL